MTQEVSAQSSYRWVILGASALMLAVSMGMMVNGASVLVLPLSAEFGWDRGSISLINFSGLAGLAVGGILMGRLADRHSTRRLTSFGIIVLGISLYLSSYCTELWQFYLLFGIAGLFGGGSLFTPLVANVGNWFTLGAGLAVGIVSAGQAMGQGGIPYIMAILIENYGWRMALASLGLTTIFALLPLAMLQRNPQIASSPQNQTSTEDNPSGLPPKYVITWLSIAVVFCCTCMSVPLMHLVPLIQDTGFALQEAGSVMFYMMIAAVLGRVFFGKLADNIGALKAYLIASCWQTVLVFFFIQISSLQTFYIFAIIYGFGYAGVMTGVLVSVRSLIPVSHRALALGIVTFFGWVGHGIGGLQGGFFFDIFQNYTITYTNAAVAGVINLVIVSALYFTIQKYKGVPPKNLSAVQA